MQNENAALKVVVITKNILLLLLMLLCNMHSEQKYLLKCIVQTSKNSELAGVLIKFEERVKQRDKRLEEASANDVALKKEIEHRDMVCVLLILIGVLCS